MFLLSSSNPNSCPNIGYLDLWFFKRKKRKNIINFLFIWNIFIFMCDVKSSCRKLHKRGDKIMVNRLDLKILIYFYTKIRAWYSSLKIALAITIRFLKLCPMEWCRHLLLTVSMNMKHSVNTCPYTNLYNLSILK